MPCTGTHFFHDMRLKYLEVIVDRIQTSNDCTKAAIYGVDLPVMLGLHRIARNNVVARLLEVRLSRVDLFSQNLGLAKMLPTRSFTEEMNWACSRTERSTVTKRLTTMSNAAAQSASCRPTGRILTAASFGSSASSRAERLWARS